MLLLLFLLLIGQIFSFGEISVFIEVLVLGLGNCVSGLQLFVYVTGNIEFFLRVQHGWDCPVDRLGEPVVEGLLGHHIVSDDLPMLVIWG